MDKIPPIRTVEITEQEIKVFEELEACQAACKQVVLEAIHQWEQMHLKRRALWDTLSKKYNIDRLKEVANLNRANRMLSIYDEKSHKTNERIAKSEELSSWREGLENLFGMP